MTESRYYWQHFTYDDDPFASLCVTDGGDVGTLVWESLIDRATGEEISVRTRCLPIDAEAEPTPDPPSPARIWESVPVPEPVVTLNPPGEGVTGLETWLWYEGSTSLRAGPVSLDGWTVTATAEVERIVWDMGDGTSVSATGAGSEAEPAATHVYERKSDGEPYTVAVTVRWHGTAEITGYGVTLSEDLGSVTPGGSRAYDVYEVRSVLTD